MPRINKKKNSKNRTEGVDADQQTDDNSSNSVQVMNTNSTTGASQLNSDSEDNSTPDVKPKIQIFKGLNDKVSIENWIKRFEMISYSSA